MQKSKLFQLLKKMKKNEFFLLEKFVHSPFFNDNNEITTLFDYFKDDYPNFQSPKLVKEKVYAHLFPKETYNARKLIYLIADTYKLVLDFLGQQEYQTNIIAQKKLKAAGLKKKEMTKEYHKELEAAKKIIIENPIKNLDYFSDLYYIEANKYTSGLPQSLADSKKNLEVVMDYLDKFYALGKLQFGTEMVSRQGILEEDYGEVLFFEKVQKIVAVGFGQENPLIELFYLTIQLLETNEEEYYWKLKNSFFEKQAFLSREGKADVLSYLINYTVKQDKTTNIHFIQESFELAKFGFTNEIFSEFIPNTEHMFHNMVINGSILEEFEWLDYFMDSLGKIPKKGYSEDIVVFAEATILYYKQNYTEARNLLLSCSFKREPDKVRMKAMLVRILYEEYLTDDSIYPLLLSTIQAFRRFLIRNKKLPSRRIVPYLNFLKYLKELSRYHFKRYFSEKSRKRLTDSVKLSNPANSQWIMEKIQEF